MSRQLDRQPGETVPQFAKRMGDLVGLINGIVQSEAGMLYDADDVLEDLRFIVDHAADDAWDECWELRVDIGREDAFSDSIHHAIAGQLLAM